MVNIIYIVYHYISCKVKKKTDIFRVNVMMMCDRKYEDF